MFVCSRLALHIPPSIPIPLKKIITKERRNKMMDLDIDLKFKHKSLKHFKNIFFVIHFIDSFFVIPFSFSWMSNEIVNR